MADKPDLFSRLFRKTQDHKKSLEQKDKQPASPRPVPANPVEKPVQEKPAKIKASLSGSKLELYQTCPKKFYFTHVKRVPRPAGASPHLSFDQALHKSMAAYYRGKRADEPFKLDRLLNLLNENWDSRGFESQNQENEFRSQAENGLRAYFDRFCQGPSRHIEVDYFFKVDIAGGEYTGKIDRVDRNPDGTIELIDYKSGKPPLGGLQELEQSLAAQMLFLATDIIWPGKVKKLTFIYLKDASVLSLVRNNNEILLARKRYLDIGEAIYQGRFEPIRSSACAYCEFQ
ncbi:MAG: PD-(D/E)XK nuclease family protein, partial [Candidatus Riflebacteria bacterium]|nr:PD-(D/E)XK nuclease family protein [Candidatus Riflebacteria bacterium]